ncbi:hypothetical protein ACFQVA_29685 [Actinomadura keratinilytica]
MEDGGKIAPRTPGTCRRSSSTGSRRWRRAHPSTSTPATPSSR